VAAWGATVAAVVLFGAADAAVDVLFGGVVVELVEVPDVLDPPFPPPPHAHNSVALAMEKNVVVMIRRAIMSILQSM
jgi:hypothetical protein